MSSLRFNGQTYRAVVNTAVKETDLRDALEVFKDYVFYGDDKFLNRFPSYISVRDARAQIEKQVKEKAPVTIPLKLIETHQDWGRRVAPAHVHHPIIVVKTPPRHPSQKKYVVLDGQHRVFTLRDAGEKTIEAYVVDLNAGRRTDRSSAVVNTGEPDDTQATNAHSEVRDSNQGAGGITQPPSSGIAAHRAQHCPVTGTTKPINRAIRAAVESSTTTTQRTRNTNKGIEMKQLYTAQDPPEEEPLGELDPPAFADPAVGDEGEPSEFEMTKELEKDPGANWRDLYLQPIIRAIRNRFDLEKGQVRLVSPKKKIPFGSDTLGFEVIGHVRFEEFTPSADEYGQSPWSFRATVDTNGELILPVEVTGN